MNEEDEDPKPVDTEAKGLCENNIMAHQGLVSSWFKHGIRIHRGMTL